MISNKKILDVRPDEIEGHLTENFHANIVVNIISPVDVPPKGEQSLPKLLLDAPTLTDNEIKKYGIIIKCMIK